MLLAAAYPAPPAPPPTHLQIPTPTPTHTPLLTLRCAPTCACSSTACPPASQWHPTAGGTPCGPPCRCCLHRGTAGRASGGQVAVGHQGWMRRSARAGTAVLHVAKPALDPRAPGRYKPAIPCIGASDAAVQRQAAPLWHGLAERHGQQAAQKAAQRSAGGRRLTPAGAAPLSIRRNATSRSSMGMDSSVWKSRNSSKPMVLSPLMSNLEMKREGCREGGEGGAVVCVDVVVG